MNANSKLSEQLIALHREKFIGILTITSQDDQQKWELFFYLGKYLWADGGYHVNRSWRRNFACYCPGVDTNSIALRNQSELRSLNYCLIDVLLQRKMVKPEQVKALVENHSQEIFFDLLQKEYNNGLKYAVQKTSAHYLLKAGFGLSLAFINLEQILFRSQTEWSIWGAKGLASCSPHHAPLLKKYHELQKHLPDVILANITRLLNGKRTLRDLAIRMDKNVLDITCGLVPYFFKGYLRLLKIPDLPQINTTQSPQ